MYVQSSIALQAMNNRSAFMNERAFVKIMCMCMCVLVFENVSNM